MYSDDDLDAAVAAGALPAASADALRAHVHAGRLSPAVDEEHFRLITGFNDIFVGIAAIILLVALAWIGDSIKLADHQYGPEPLTGLFVAAAAWGLAEFFTLKRRMALPSIILLLAFVGGVFATAASILVVGLDPVPGDEGERLLAFILATSAAVAAGAAWLHWRRFRVPITVAAGAAALVAMVLALIGTALDFDGEGMPDIILVAMLVAGLGVFALAMRWDGSDPRRETRRSDVAFWLHLLAAPLIVHSVFSLTGLNDGDGSVVKAVAVILVYVLLALAALIIDRRALLVSALAYVLWALSDLFEEAGAVELSFALTAFVIGSALLLLSAFWHNARRAVVQPLPDGMRARLPVLDRSVAVAA